MKECVCVEVMKISDRRLRISDSLKISDFSAYGCCSTPSNKPMKVGLSKKAGKKYGMMVITRTSRDAKQLVSREDARSHDTIIA